MYVFANVMGFQRRRGNIQVYSFPIHPGCVSTFFFCFDDTIHKAGQNRMVVFMVSSFIFMFVFEVFSFSSSSFLFFIFCI
jgi:hypothetical protein